MSNVFILLWAVFAGILGSLQAAINGGLARYTNSLTATLVSFVVGTIALLVIVIGGRQLNISNFAGIPWYYTIGGLLGVGFVLTMVISVSKIGVAGTTAAVIAGQLIMAVLIDHFGWFGTEIQKIDLLRIAGVIFLFLGVKLIFH